jgi:histidinol-phosphatase (PHP family)
MTDGHIHIERGDYTLEWIKRFADRAAETGLDEIRLLEHSFRFVEFVPMYDSVRAHSGFVDEWFGRVGGVRGLGEYPELIDKVRSVRFPVVIRFGLEICYFKEHEGLIAELTRGKGFDFLLGSVHFVDGFAFDHKPEHWEGIDIDRIFRRYFEDEVSLAKSGIFDGIGHPDTIKLFGHKPSFPLTGYYERLAAALAESGMYADQNSGAERRCPATAPLGMDRELISILIKHGVPIVTSSDAHCPEDVGYRIRDLEEIVSGCR